MYFSLLFIFFTLCKGNDKTVLMTEVFEIPVDPSLFNWTYDLSDKFVFQPSLAEHPDLPSWMNFVYNEESRTGYLYGVPPSEHNARVPIQIVGLNKRNYETKCEEINVVVSEKLNPAKFEVHLKIDNVNVEDMFNVDKMELLKDIFRKQLWKDSQNDLYMTFLQSAIQLGARKPVNPNDREGVVLRLGSQAPFSSELIELQEEVRPLWKVPTCPRAFKRTSVERYFRDGGFALDWCSFRLIDDNNSAMAGVNEKLLNSIDISFEDRWQPISKSEIPRKTYTSDIILTILLPMFSMIFLGMILTFILCLQHETIVDEPSEAFFEYIFHICVDYKRSKDSEEFSSNEINHYDINIASESLRNISCNRDSCISPDPALLITSQTNSPTSTISRGVHCRPSPPPYVRPKFKPDL